MSGVRLSRAWVILLLPVAALTGCRSAPPSSGDAIVKTAERGPLSLTVTVSPSRGRVGDVLRVQVVARGPEDYTFTLPEADAFGELGAQVADEFDPRPSASGREWRRVFSVDVMAGGQLTIPSLAVEYRREAPANDAALTSPTTGPVNTQPAVANVLQCEPIVVEVASALTDEDAPTAPRDITGTLIPPAPPMPLWQKLALAGAAVAVVVAALVAYRVLRARALRPPPPIPPDEWALRELEALAATGAVGPERAAAYYYRLTEIVRVYIERQFGLRAPEMTSEEFLVHVTRSRDAARYDMVRLQIFIGACDLVKYAALAPSQEDVDAALDTARSYVRETASAVRSRAAAGPTT